MSGSIENNNFRISGPMAVKALLGFAIAILIAVGGWMVARAEAAVAKAEAAEHAVLQVQGDVKEIRARIDAVKDKIDGVERKLDVVIRYTKPKEQ